MRELRAAVEILRANRTLMLVTVFTAVPVGYLAAANILLAPFVERELRGTAAGFGLLDSAWGVGALVAGLFVSKIFGEHRYVSLPLSLILTGACGFVFGIAPSFPSALVAAVFLGLFLSCANIMFPAFVQRDAPDSHLGKLMSAVFMVSSGVQLLFVVWIGTAGDEVSPAPSWSGAPW